MGSDRHVLEISLHGPMRLRWSSGAEVAGLGAKQMALIAMLTRGAGMSRSRAWLVANLWGRVDQRLGRSSLRQALSAMRQRLGDDFDRVFDLRADIVSLRAEAIRLIGGPEDGDFLEGLDLAEEGFEDWLRDQRLSPPPAQARGPGAPSPGATISPHPRIAVLPVAGFCLPREIEGMGDFFAQELIRALSRLHLLDVISHLSSRSVAAENVDLALIRERLSVDYVVSGTLRMAGGRPLLTIDCHDCEHGTHLWDGRFSIPADAQFDREEGLVAEVAGEILRSILTRPAHLGAHRPLPDVATHRLLMSGISLTYSVGRRQFAQAHDILTELARRAPTHSVPQAWFAQWRLLKIYQGWSEDPAADRRLAEAHILRGLDLNPSCALTLAMEGNVRTVLQADFAAAAESFAAAQAVNASSALASTLRSVLHTFLGDGATAVSLAERSMTLSPCDPRSHFFNALHAAAYLVNRDYERAVDLAEASLRLSPHHISALRSKIIGLSLAGERDAARAAAADLMRIAPGTSVAGYLAQHPAKQTGVAEIWADALGRAGVPPT
ncbi:MAG: hypothetical protein ACOCYW_03205 [Roseicyclus sp.]